MPLFRVHCDFFPLCGSFILKTLCGAHNRWVLTRYDIVKVSIFFDVCSNVIFDPKIHFFYQGGKTSCKCENERIPHLFPWWKTLKYYPTALKSRKKIMYFFCGFPSHTFLLLENNDTRIKQQQKSEVDGDRTGKFFRNRM